MHLVLQKGTHLATTVPGFFRIHVEHTSGTIALVELLVNWIERGRDEDICANLARAFGLSA